MAIAVCALAIAGCGQTQAPELGPGRLDGGCVVATRSDHADSMITMGLAEPIGPANAPLARTMSERMLFRLLYEPLVHVDCGGRVYPALATAWRSDAGHRVWYFTLRDRAAFWDGSAVTPVDVVKSWRARPEANALVPIDSVTVVGDREVRVGLAVPSPSPIVFAQLALAVTKRQPTSSWPSGTTPFDVTLQDAVGNGVIRIHRRAGNRPLVEFRATRARDARDFLDQSVDVVVTDQATALNYAATRTSVYTSAPLAWDRTYIVLVPERVRARTGAQPPRQLLVNIARDAVRTEAQAAAPPFWWDDGPSCEMATAPMPSAERGEGRRIAYDRRDATARDLAERLVALSASSPGDAGLEFMSPTWSTDATNLQASGVGADEFSESVRRGVEAGYVFPLPRFVWDRCAALNGLLSRIPWLTPQPETVRRGLAHALVPLVDVRARAVFRHGRVAAVTDWDGTFRLLP